MNMMGMVCPRTGQFFAIEVSHSGADTFRAFPDESEKYVHFERTRTVLILGGGFCLTEFDL